MKMGTIGKLNVVFCLLLLGSCRSKILRGIRLKVGPLLDETGKYVYERYASSGTYYEHCRYCPKGAFDNTEANVQTQEPLCIAKYDNIKEEITAFEREHFKIPICKIGDIPGCGSPPEDKKTGAFEWFCEPGYSNNNFSVYSSCALIQRETETVDWSYYCNESLQWEEESNNFASVMCKMDAPNTQTKGYSSSTSTELFIVGIIGVVVVVGLVFVAAFIFKKRKGNGDNTKVSVFQDQYKNFTESTNQLVSGYSGIPTDTVLVGKEM